MDTYLSQLDKMSRWWYADGSPGNILKEEWKPITSAATLEVNGNILLMRCVAASIAGLTQVTGRIVEVGIHKLRTLGLSPKAIRYAMGYAPIPPLGTDFEVAMARTNDAILYGGTVYCTVDYEDEAALQKIMEQAPSIASKDYGKPFLQIFREADRDFYKIDHGLFAPAVLMINNAKTGRIFKAGQINPEVLAGSLGF